MAPVMLGVRRYLVTVAHLRPSQPLHRVRLRAVRALLSMAPPSLLRRRVAPAATGLPEAFRSIGARTATADDAQASARGSLTFFGIERNVFADGWSPPDVPRLWRFHAGYLECAWTFAAHPDRAWAAPAFAGLVRRWLDDHPTRRGDAWAPYVASLRAWALCDVHRELIAGSSDEPWYVELLDLHLRVLRRQLELDVGGNHLLKNLKALIGLGVLLGDGRTVRRACSRLEREIRRQVLEDGGHYERSPSYHCQVLGDLIDVRGLLETAGVAPVQGIDDAIARMQSWLGWMLLPDGDVALFNDCSLVGGRVLAALEPTAPPRATGGELHLLADSGYAIFRHVNGIHAIVDVGEPCPPDLPAHAHADCLSLQVSLGPSRVIVDTGSSTYERSERRAHERSTGAHSTVEIDGESQTDVWHTFRAGRLAHPTVRVADGRLVATHDGYDRLPGRPRHERTVQWSEDALVIDDIVIRLRGRSAILRHVLGDTAVDEVDGAWRCGPLRIQCARAGTDARIELIDAQVADGIGLLRDARVLTARAEGVDRVQWRTVISRDPRDAGQVT